MVPWFKVSLDRPEELGLHLVTAGACFTKCLKSKIFYVPYRLCGTNKNLELKMFIEIGTCIGSPGLWLFKINDVIS